ncbi:M23 family metallopeptidase [Oceanispirochaeta crateris]|uniref:M23 family metallopeptidase n=1 Tax=Oceanispirochaeta crateris TaxID=2518645 RepID=A0A5C1QKX0_9SPIO|nr:M23 family metallopeptidase [Oceanispirochaeta crateris]QEN07254.1 M23 family metallopeptidase [Oceanispirochaeta crateris]
MLETADEHSMGHFRFFAVKKRWRSVFLTLFIISALIFQLIISRNNQATAAYVEKNNKELSTVTVAEEAPPAVLEVKNTYIQSGSSLSYHLESNGITASDSSAIIDAVKDVINLRRLQAGQKVELHFENQYFAGIMIPVSIDKDILVNRSTSSGFEVVEQYKNLRSYPSSIDAVVESSLYGSCLDQGIPENIIMELIQLYSFDVDFQRDIHKGDQLHVTFEVVYDEEGTPVDTGNILYTTLKTGGQDLAIYRFENSQGKADFYNPEGQTVRKTLLKTPINGAYITSGFGPRVSPISGYNSVHKGIDFGAPRGTPIKTSGDGTVTYAGYNDVYGNHVIVRHVNSYVTLYAHMSAFGRGIRRGTSVDQGQVIGYVGTTGMSTGPHLHYEVRYNGRQINPASVKFPPGHTLAGEDARLYQNLLSSYESSLP